MQSIIIGLFNFLDLLTIRNYGAESFKLNDAPVTEKNKGCTAWFFLVHYGFFHLGYCIFLLIDFGVTTVDKNVLMIGVAAFLFESLLGFIRQKQLEREVEFNIGSMFFMPYLRIIPMHLMILIPKFTGIKPSLIFLVLKMIADILSYMLYHTMSSKTSKTLKAGKR